MGSFGVSWRRKRRNQHEPHTRPDRKAEVEGLPYHGITPALIGSVIVTCCRSRARH